MLTISVSTAISIPGTSIAGIATLSTNEVTQISQLCLANNTTTVAALAFDKTKLAAIFVVSDIATNVTFGGAGNPALVLLAGVPYAWTNQSLLTNPFANNCTNCSIANNNATTNATVQVVAALNT